MPRPRKRSDNRGRSRAPDDDQSQNSSRRKHGREDDQGSPPPRRQRIGRDSTVSQTSPGNRRASGENIPPAPAKDPPKPDLTRAGQRWTKEEDEYLLAQRKMNVPYSVIMIHLKKTALAARLHWHNLNNKIKATEQARAEEWARNHPDADNPVVGASTDFTHVFGSGQQTETSASFRPVDHASAGAQSMPRNQSQAYRPLLPRASHGSRPALPPLITTGLEASSQRNATEGPHDMQRRLTQAVERESATYWERIAAQSGMPPEQCQRLFHLYNAQYAQYHQPGMPANGQAEAPRYGPSSYGGDQASCQGAATYPRTQPVYNGTTYYQQAHPEHRQSQLPTPPQTAPAVAQRQVDRTPMPAEPHSGHGDADGLRHLSMAASLQRPAAESSNELVSPRTEAGPVHAQIHASLAMRTTNRVVSYLPPAAEMSQQHSAPEPAADASTDKPSDPATANDGGNTNRQDSSARMSISSLLR